jgi:hypothetical protein
VHTCTLYPDVHRLLAGPHGNLARGFQPGTILLGSRGRRMDEPGPQPPVDFIEWGAGPLGIWGGAIHWRIGCALDQWQRASSRFEESQHSRPIECEAGTRRRDGQNCGVAAPVLIGGGLGTARPSAHWGCPVSTYQPWISTICLLVKTKNNINIYLRNRRCRRETNYDWFVAVSRCRQRRQACKPAAAVAV